MEDVIRARQREFDRAELGADDGALRRLIADDFQSIGPKGFVMDKEAWVGRHVHFKYLALETSELTVRCYDRAAVARFVQRNRAVYQGREMEHTTRVSEVWVEQGGAWRLAGIQFSPMADA
jgi:hypothetical protein